MCLSSAKGLLRWEAGNVENRLARRGEGPTPARPRQPTWSWTYCHVEPQAQGAQLSLQGTDPQVTNSHTRRRAVCRFLPVAAHSLGMCRTRGTGAPAGGWRGEQRDRVLSTDTVFLGDSQRPYNPWTPAKWIRTGRRRRMPPTGRVQLR